jgi:hypothetical protein
MPDSPHYTRNGYIFGFITVLLWAGFVLLSRTAESNGLNGFDLTALRFGTAAIFLVPAWLFWLRLPLFNWRMLALVATGGIGYAVSVYSAFHFSPASHGAGRPHIVDMIKNNEIVMVINTVEERRNAIADSRAIRTSSLLARVTTFTTIFGAEAAVEGMKYLDKLDVYSVQELHAQLAA